MKNDILIHYMVTKQETKVDIEKIIQFIITYVQNHLVYFKYEPTFYNNVLIFGLIGFKREHKKLQKRIGSDITKFGGKLNILKGEKNG